MKAFSFPEHYKVVQLAQPKTSNGGFTTDAVSLKNCHRAWFLFDMTQAVAHATLLTPRQATNVAIGTNAVFPTTNIWANEDTAAGDTWVEQTRAANYTVASDVKNKQVYIEVDPRSLTDTYDVVYATIADSSQATNFITVSIIMDLRFRGRVASQLSAIVD